MYEAGSASRSFVSPVTRMTKQTQFHVGYWLAAIIGILLLQHFYSISQRIEALPYSQFQQLLQEGKVDRVAVSDRSIQGTLKEPLPNGKKQFVTTRVDSQLAGDLQKFGVTYSGEVESTLVQDLLSWVVPAVVFFGLWTFLARRMSQGVGGGLMSIGKSKAKIYVESDTGVTFDDVAGVASWRGSKNAIAFSIPRSARSLPITRWAMHWSAYRCPEPIRSTRSRSFRAASALSVTPSSARPRTDSS